MSESFHPPDELPEDAAPARRAGSEDEPSGIGSFYPWPLADHAVKQALDRCFADGSWGRYHGPYGNRLRAELAQMHGVEHVTLCSSGTIAVELALRGLKVSPGDEVVLAGYDFPGNFRAIEAIGARPVLVDIDPDAWRLDPANLPAAVSPQTRAIVVSHLHGGMADMPQIMAFAAKHGLGVIEDACQSPGATIGGRMAGAWGDVGVLSFGGSKLLTAGRGGAVLTRHADVQQRIKVYTERGNDAFPLSELQAAVLVPQLAQLNERNRLRRANVDRILAETAKYGALQPVKICPQTQPSFYKLAWLLSGALARPICSRDMFLAAAQANRIPLAAGFRGFTQRSARRCRAAGDLHYSAVAASQTVVLHHPVLLAGDEEVEQMIARLVELLDRTQ